jgi:Do/DeqQ family serine protease
MKPLSSRVSRILALSWLLLFAQTGLAALPAMLSDQEVPSLAPLIEKVSPAVVNISTTATAEVPQNPLMQDPFFRRFFDGPQMPRQQQVQALGSGVIVNAEEGYVLTNHHVVANADEIRVQLQDGREFQAKLVGSDEDTDIAVIQIDANNLTALPMADSSELRVGDFVLAIGNPFGLEHTVTSGIVSGLGRQLGGGGGARLQDFIQTDASINPGNSGGALVNLRGELVGINTAILSRSGGNIGIGFAVPINMAKQVMQQLIEYGEVRRGVLGIRVQDLTPDLARALGVDADQGAVIAQVAPNSNAAKAGLESGDVVIEVNGEPVTGANDLANRIGVLQIGDEVELTIVRDGETQTITATVGDPGITTADAGSLHPKLEGAQFANLDQRSPLYGEVQGVLVTAVQPNSPVSRYLAPGDVILSVNQQPVTDLDEFKAAVQGADQLLLNVQRGQAARYVVIE